MRLHCVRHARPQVSGICYGHTDISVESFKFDPSIKRVVDSSAAIFSSPSIRCTYMAQKYAGNNAVSLDSRLMEINFGAWEGIPWDEIPVEQLDVWAKNISSFKPPMGESFEELVVRVVAWLTELLAFPLGEYVVFTHAGVIKALRVLVLKESFELAANYRPAFHQVVSFDVSCFSDY